MLSRYSTHLASHARSVAAISTASTRAHGTHSTNKPGGTLHVLCPGQQLHRTPLCQPKLSTSAVTAKRHIVYNFTTAELSTAKLNKVDRCLEIEWEGEKDVQRFPFVFLRDNCPCPTCFHPSAQSRILLVRQLDMDVMATELKVGDRKLNISWSDGHESEFPLDWLRAREFRERAFQERDAFLQREPTLWNRVMMQGKVKTATFDELMTDDHALYRWIETLEKEGIFLINDTPLAVGQLEKLAQRVCFIRVTNYGKQFTVKAKMDASNVAYTSGMLGLHADLIYYDYAPGMQMLHCIQQVPTKGGENMFTDAFYIADLLREKYPEHYKTLTTTPVDTYDIGHDYYEFFKYHRGMTIRTDFEGKVTRVSYSNHARTTWMSLPYEKIVPFYRAMTTFDKLMYEPENHIVMKLKEGQIICFHNYRVLHGRQGYKILEEGERHLEGGYIDWDELHSRRRVLQIKLNIKS